MTDHHCKELFRCYKCVNIDYAKNHTDNSYNVEFTTDEAGNRQLNCKVNSEQDAENICECDKRFAENIAATDDSCNVRLEIAQGLISSQVGFDVFHLQISQSECFINKLI